MPMDAATDMTALSLFLYSHLLSAGVTSLSVPYPAFTNAFTKVDARFARAESPCRFLHTNSGGTSQELHDEHLHALSLPLPRNR